MNDKLLELRDRIDALDDQLLALLNERGRLAQEVGHAKNGASIYRPEREAQVVRRLQAANAGPLPKESVSRLFKEIMSACRSLEQPMTVSYLGPEGTFSEAATVKQFGGSVQGMPVTSFDEVFRAVELEQAHYGVVPVENSTEGAIGRSLDLLLTTPLSICGEVVLRVRQNLLRKDGGLDAIRVIYSHAQSLGQCQGWLNAHLPGVERIAVSSNAEAARLAAEQPDAVAIAGEIAAGHYDLVIVAPGIEDDAGNTTRFLVLGRDVTAPSGKDKTSLAVYVKNKPGALLELIEPFARMGVGLSKLESRPARSGSWEYVFFIDLDGHRQESKVAEAIKEAAGHALSLKVLGSYPTAH
jgi:chorismate mutase/prephenate dehydratase